MRTLPDVREGQALTALEALALSARSPLSQSPRLWRETEIALSGARLYSRSSASIRTRTSGLGDRIGGAEMTKP